MVSSTFFVPRLTLKSLLCRTKELLQLLKIRTKSKQETLKLNSNIFKQVLPGRSCEAPRPKVNVCWQEHLHISLNNQLIQSGFYTSLRPGTSLQHVPVNCQLKRMQNFNPFREERLQIFPFPGACCIAKMEFSRGCQVFCQV